MSQIFPIEAVTPEQEARIPFFMEKWAELLERPIDREKATALLQEMCSQREALPEIVFTESFEDFVETAEDLLEKAKAKYGHQYRNGSLAVHCSIDLHNFKVKLGERLRSRLRLLGLKLYSDLSKKLRTKLESNLYRLISLHIARRLTPRGVHESYVLYFFYDQARLFDFGDTLGANFAGVGLEKYCDIQLNLPITFFAGDSIIVCEKPQISRAHDAFHSDTEAAVRWADGTGFYFLNGVAFEKDLWETIVKGEMSFLEILQIKDAEQRHQAFLYNEKAFTKLAPQLIDRSDAGAELYLIENSDLNRAFGDEQIWFLRFHDDERLPPESRRYEEIDPEFAAARRDADAALQYHCEFLEIYSMTYAEEKQYWRDKT